MEKIWEFRQGCVWFLETEPRYCINSNSNTMCFNNKINYTFILNPLMQIFPQHLEILQRFPT